MELAALYYTLLMILGIGVIIFVHELGHFLAAKWAGVRVEAFSIGFGPALFTRRVGETEYKIGLVPLGGYVKMAGESPGEARTGDPREFPAKSVGARGVIISAGVVMNMLFACVVFPLAFSLGVMKKAPVVGEVIPGGPAWEAGLRPGDRILALGGRAVYSFEEIQFEVALAGGPLRLEFLRGGRRAVTLVSPTYDDEAGFPMIGVRPAVADTVYVEPNPRVPVPGFDRRLRLRRLNGVPAAALRERLEELQKELEETPRDVELVGVDAEGREHRFRLPGRLEEVDEWFLGVRFVGTSRVKAVQRGSPWPLRRGDRIWRVGERWLRSGEAFREAVLAAPPGPVTLTVERLQEPGRLVTLTVRALADPQRRRALLDSLTFEIGTVVRPLPGYPAAAAGFQPDDRIVAIHGREVTGPRGVRELLQRFDPRRFPRGFTFTVERLRTERTPPEPQRVVLRAAPVKRKVNRALRAFTLVEEPLLEKVKFPFPRSLWMGLRYTRIWTYNILNTLGRIVTGRLSPRTLGGIITIGRVTYDRAKKGLVNLLYFLAILSVNLAVINLLPIPILDGGHLLFLLVEKLKGSPVSERVVRLGHAIGFAIILALILFVTFNDIQRWISR